MGNKVKYNLKNVHAAKLTETVVNGVTSFFVCHAPGHSRRCEHLPGC